MTERNAPVRRGWLFWATAVGPFAVAVCGPYLPLLIVFGGTLPAAAPHPPPQVVGAVAAIAVLGFLASLAGVYGRGVRHFPSTLGAPIIAIILTQIVATGWALHAKAGVFSIVVTLAGFVILIACADVLRDPRTRRAFLGCYLASAVMAILIACLLSVMRLPPAMYAYEHGRASGSFLQPNEFAGYMLFVIPMGLAQIAAPRWLRGLGLTSAVAGSVGLFLSVSRAAITSLAVALIIFVRQLGRKPALAYGVAAGCGLLLLVTVFANVAHDPSENASRLAVWAGSLRIAQRFALTGVGPFGFHFVYPQFRLPEYSVDEVHAHSLPLQLLIEYGVLGLAAVIWFVIAAILECGRVWRSIGDDRERTLLFAAVVSGFAASALQNSIDVVTTFLLVLAWPMLGLLLALGQPRTVSA